MKIWMRKALTATRSPIESTPLATCCAARIMVTVTPMAMSAPWPALSSDSEDCTFVEVSSHSLRLRS